MGRGLVGVVGIALVALAAGCAPPDEAAPTREPAPPFRHTAFYDALSAAADRFNQQGGDWLEDLGDAPFYGLAHYTHRAHDLGEAAAQAKADAARAREAALLVDVDFFTADLQEVTMSALGLAEHIWVTGDRTHQPVLDSFVDRMDALVGAVGYYLTPGVVDSWALDTYGSTSVSALIGLVNTEYVVRVGGAEAQRRLDWAIQLAAHIDAAAWDGSSYDFGPGRPEVDLYPNVAMIALNARLATLTGVEAYKERALAGYAAIQPLKLSDAPARYYSAYSAAAMGAQSTDYSTLSSQNYLMLALALLYQATGEARFVAELDRVVDGLESLLFSEWCLADVHHEVCAPTCTTPDVCLVDACTADTCQPGVLHHFMDGRAALPTDPEFFCSGCNLQLLHVMWYRRTQL
ncbi:MAG: hypothetical protein IT373_36860 [Polyangiaceae bacterium]|nr:hypothetical protein [Polyangiaceae bacterium]